MNNVVWAVWKDKATSKKKSSLGSRGGTCLAGWSALTPGKNKKAAGAAEEDRSVQEEVTLYSGW